MKALESVRNSGDLVPVGDRLRALAAWRSAVLGLAVLVIVLVPSFSKQNRLPYVAGVIGFLVASWLLTTAALRRNHARRTLLLMRGLLMADAVAIVMVSLTLGGTDSPLRYLIILQAVEVTLLASFRTGLRLVAWQSLLISGFYVVGSAVWPDAVVFAVDASGRNELIGVVGCAWIAAITTASLAAANERELRRRRYDLEQLSAYHGTISEAVDAAAVAEGFVQSVVDEFQASRVLVALPEIDGRLTVCATHGFDAPPTVLHLRQGSLVAEAVNASSTLLVSDLRPETDVELLVHFPPEVRLAALAIRTPAGRGIVLVEPPQTQAGRVERRIVSMLERYRDELESRVSNLFLIDSLRRAATTDALTGVANRARLRDALHAETQESIRCGSPLSVVILDVDHFKKVNDVHGHAAGDSVLKQVAAALTGSVRPYDLVARYGGEEFVVLLPGTDLADAAQLAERLRATVASSTSPVAVTISLGVARFDPAIDDEDHVIARADALLYDAKQGGRNRVRVADQRPFTGSSGAPLPPPVPHI